MEVLFATLDLPQLDESRYSRMLAASSPADCHSLDRGQLTHHLIPIL
jgi:hypothetical protein